MLPRWAPELLSASVSTCCDPSSSILPHCAVLGGHGESQTCGAHPWDLCMLVDVRAKEDSCFHPAGSPKEHEFLEVVCVS